MSRITVKPAGDDRRVPVEGRKGSYFEQGVAREVHHTRYIKRRLRAGDLVEVKADTPAAPQAGASKAGDPVEVEVKVAAAPAAAQVAQPAPATAASAATVSTATKGE